MAVMHCIITVTIDIIKTAATEESRDPNRNLSEVKTRTKTEKLSNKTINLIARRIHKTLIKGSQNFIRSRDHKNMIFRIIFSRFRNKNNTAAFIMLTILCIDMKVSRPMLILA